MRPQNRWQNRWPAALPVAAVIALGGCSGAGTPEAEAEAPVTVETVAGSDVSRLTLTEQAATRLGIVTEPVRTAPDGSGLVVPFAAIVYDSSGTPWTFTSGEGRTYQREKVVIASIDGTTVRLSSGPAAGTNVVTVGAAELVGAEAGLGV